MITRLSLFIFPATSSLRILNRVLPSYSFSKDFNCRYYSNSPQEKPPKKMSGRQDTFYFEESPLTAAITDRAKRTEVYKRTPVVLVFGWAGAKDQNLQKYKSIYSSFGFHTLRFSPSNKLTFLDTAKHKGYAYDLLALMRNHHELVNNPILIHMFSNACGIVMYQHIINEINGTNGVVSNKDFAFFKRNHCGIIFDSAPGMPKYFSLLGGVFDLTEGQIKSTLARYVFSAAMVSLFAAYQAINLNNSYFNKVFETLMRDERDWVPALGIYSRADKLISADNIEKFFQQRRKLFPNWKLKEVVYTDAPHVMIYPTHPEEYVKYIKEHLELCKLLSPDSAKPQVASKL